MTALVMGGSPGAGERRRREAGTTDAVVGTRRYRPVVAAARGRRKRTVHDAASAEAAKDVDLLHKTVGTCYDPLPRMRTNAFPQWVTAIINPSGPPPFL